MCVFKIQKWKWVKKLKASLVHCQRNPHHSSDRKTSWVKSHLLKEKEPHIHRGEPARLTLCLTSHWNEKTTTRHHQRKSPRLAKASVGVGESWSPHVESSPTACLCLVGANNDFHYFQWLRETSTGEYCFVTRDHERNWLFSAPK